MSRQNTLSTLALLLAGSLAGPAVHASSLDPSDPKSRAQVKAELDLARHDGSFEQMTHNRSFPPGLETTLQTSRDESAVLSSSTLSGQGDLKFAPPAAGVKSRDEVQRELQRAREDGSLRKLNSEREY